MPAPAARALRYVSPAVLTAIIMPAVLLPDGEFKVANNYVLDRSRTFADANKGSRMTHPVCAGQHG
ncbi:MAG: AzlD domain-containing protein [Anaerolineae bacterium]|nr:AzlD domain-containing protein [Anaerolineae bacterium]